MLFAVIIIVRSQWQRVYLKNYWKKNICPIAGLFDTLEIDGFTVKVCDEINVKLSKHRARSLKEMEKSGGFVGSFDLIIPLTKECSKEVYKYSTYSSVMVEDWQVDEPLQDENNIDKTLCSYRKIRDIIFEKIKDRFQDYY